MHSILFAMSPTGFDLHNASDCGGKLVHKALGEMSLIFASSKTHFLMLCFATFSLTLEHIDFHFPFEILAQMMKFLARFARIT